MTGVKMRHYVLALPFIPLLKWQSGFTWRKNYVGGNHEYTLQT